MLSQFDTRFTYFGTQEPTTGLPGLVIRDYERGVEMPMGLLTQDMEEMFARVMTACILLTEGIEVRLNVDSIQVELDDIIEGPDKVCFYGTEIGNIQVLTPEHPINVNIIDTEES